MGNVNVTPEEEEVSASARATDENAMPQSPPTTPTTTHSPLLFAPQVSISFNVAHSTLPHPQLLLLYCFLNILLFSFPT